MTLKRFWDVTKIIFNIIGVFAVIAVLYLISRRAAGNNRGIAERVDDDINSIGDSAERISDSVERTTEHTERAIESTDRGNTALDDAAVRLKGLIQRLQTDGIAGNNGT